MVPARTVFLLLAVSLAALAGMTLDPTGSTERDSVEPAGGDDQQRVAPTARGELERLTSFPTLDPTTPADVREILRYCEAAGSEQIADLRRAALESSHPLAVGNALRALGRLGAVMGDPDLLALVEDERPRVRQELVMALGVSGDPAALGMLSPLLDSEPGLRPLVIQALGRLGGDQARAILATVRPSDETERAYLRTALR